MVFFRFTFDKFSSQDLLLQEFSHWRDEDGTLIVAFWNHIIEADLGHNNIKSIDESVVSLLCFLFPPPLPL